MEACRAWGTIWGVWGVEGTLAQQSDISWRTRGGVFCGSSSRCGRAPLRISFSSWCWFTIESNGRWHRGRGWMDGWVGK